jgi:hypothetical protein
VIVALGDLTRPSSVSANKSNRSKVAARGGEKMTAEIAVLNKHGVAIAADSKVTITGSGGQKTFDTVNKVFTLSKRHPIGIMVYGNAEFMEYPWEVIVKMFRERHGRDARPTVEEWGKDFLDYLRVFGKIEEKHQRENTDAILSSIFESVLNRSFSDARAEKISFADSGFVEVLIAHVDSMVGKLKKTKKLYSSDEQDKFLSHYKNAIDDNIERLFSEFKSEPLKEKLRDLAKEALFSDSFSPLSSGIVITGFGEEEYFPALVQYNTDGYIGDKIKMSEERRSDIRRDMPAAIFPFAQKDMVQRFMNGVDPQYAKASLRIHVESMIQNCMNVLDEYGKDEFKTEEVRKKIRKASDASIKPIVEKLRGFASEMFSDPILEMVTMLPKDELPHLAESLVALTSLKRHVSDDAETVGGPIDVALISKGDGFIWIRRKHYFKPELNPHFARNYFEASNVGEAK